MKTLIALLLAAIVLGGTWWVVERPGEGLDGLQSEARLALRRVGYALGIGDGDRLARRIDALERELTRTMTAAEAGVVQRRLDDTEVRIEETESRLASAQRLAADSNEGRGMLLGGFDVDVERRLDALDRKLQRSVATLRASMEAARIESARLAARNRDLEASLAADDGLAKNVEYRIYFGKNSAKVSTAAARTLDSFIARELERTTGVAIFGFADRTGPSSLNERLARERAANVRLYLIRHGFDYTKIDDVAGLDGDATRASPDRGRDGAERRMALLFASQP